MIKRLLAKRIFGLPAPVVIVVVAGAAYWWWTRSGTSDTSSADGTDPATTDSAGTGPFDAADVGRAPSVTYTTINKYPAKHRHRRHHHHRTGGGRRRGRAPTSAARSIGARR